MAFIVGELAAPVSADTSGFTSAISDVKRQGASAAEQIKKKFNEIGDSLISTGKQLTTRVTAPLAALAGLSVKNYDVQIQAEKRLEAALRASGEEVKNNLADFKQYASHLQSLTTVGDESTLQMLQVAKSMGLTNEQAKRAAKNSIALAKAMGMNEQSAIRYAAALEQGESTMLARYLPGLRQIDDMSKRAAEAQRLLGQMFSAATSEAQNGLGPLIQIKNTLGDFSEEIGEIVLKRMKPFIEILGDTVNWFQSLSAESKGLIVTVGSLAAAIGPLLISAGALVKLMPILASGFAALTSPISLTIAGIGALSAAIVYAYDNWDAIIDRVSDIGWWRNALVDMIQFFLDYNPIKLVIDGFNALLAYFGELQIPNPFQGVSEALEGLKGETKEYQHQFGSFTDAIMDTWDKLMGLDMGGGGGIDSVLRLSDDTLNRLQIATNLLNGQLYPAITNTKTSTQGLSDTFAWMSNVLSENLHPTVEKSKEILEKTSTSGQQMGSAVGSALSQAAVNGKSLLDTVKNLVKQFASRVLMKGISMLLGGGPIGGAGIVSSLFGGFFANGGRPPTGIPSVVGERGPELFVPDNAGTIIPNHKLGGGSRTVQLRINGQFVQSGSELRAVINESQHIDLS